MATYYGTCYNSKGQAMTSANGMNGYSFYVEVTYTQSIENNTSTLTIKPYVVDAHGGAFTWYFKLDGSDYYSVYQNTYSQGNTVSGSTATKTVTHNADGTKTFTLNVSVETSYVAGANNNLNTYSIQRASLSQSITLNTIPRTSDFSFGSFTMGTAGDISISRASSSFTHKVTYKFGSASGTISSNATTSASWTPSRDLGYQIPNSLSGTGTITVATYSGSTHIGSKSKTFTLWVTGDMQPTFGEIGEAGIGLFQGQYVQGKSRISLSIDDAVGSYGSTITSYSIVGNSLNINEYYGTSGYLTASGTQTYTAKVTDSRGRTCTKTKSIYVHRYQAPRVEWCVLSPCRGNDNKEPYDKGTYLYCQVNYAIENIGGFNTNAKRYKLEMKPTNSSSWSTLVDSSLSFYDAQDFEINTTSTLDLTKSYDVRVSFSDSYGTTTLTGTVRAGSCLLDIEKNGIGVGKYWEQGVLDISGDVYVDGTLLIEEGTFNPAFYVSNGCSGVYTRRYGFYQKVGKWCTCTIALVVENFNSGSTPSNQFKITNLPYYNKGGYTAVTIGHQSGLKYTDADSSTRAYIRPNEVDIVFVITRETVGGVYTVTGNNISGTNLDIQVSFTYKVE